MYVSDDGLRYTSGLAMTNSMFFDFLMATRCTSGTGFRPGRSKIQDDTINHEDKFHYIVKVHMHEKTDFNVAHSLVSWLRLKIATFSATKKHLNNPVHLYTYTSVHPCTLAYLYICAPCIRQDVQAYRGVQMYKGVKPCISAHPCTPVYLYICTPLYTCIPNDLCNPVYKRLYRHIGVYRCTGIQEFKPLYTCTPLYTCICLYNIL